MSDSPNIDEQLLQRLRQRAQNQGVSVNKLLADFLAPDTSTQQTPYAYLDAAPSAIIVVDVSQPHQPAIYVNRAFEQQTGYPSAEVIGRNLNFLQGDDRDQQGRTTMREAIQQGQSCTAILRNYRKDGSMFWNEIRLAPLADERGQITRYIGIQNDVTARNQTERVLRDKEHTLAMALRAAHAGVWVWDVVSDRIAWDTDMEAMHGLKPGTFGGNYPAWRAAVHPDDLPGAEASIQSALAGEKPFNEEFRVVWPDGTVRHILGQAIVVCDENNGQPLQMVGVNSDITERKQMEATLHESEELYRNLFENAMHQVHLWKLVRDEQGAIKTWQLVEVNPAALKAWGKNRADIIGKTPDEIFLHNATEQFMPIVKKIFSEGTPYTWEAYFPPTGEFLHMISVPFGEYFISTGTDITERKQMEDALRKSEELYRNLLNNLNAGVVVHSADTEIMLANPAAATLLGLPEERILGKDAADSQWQFVHDDGNRMQVEDYPVSRILATRNIIRSQVVGIQHIETGDITWVLTNGFPIFRNDSEIEQAVVTFSDITERKQMEDQLRQQRDELDRFFTVTLDLLCIAEMDGTFIRVNNAWETTLGYPVEELIGRTVLDFLHPDDVQPTQDALAQLSRQEQVIGFTHRIRTPDGDYRVIEWRSNPYGNLLYAAGRDITERKQMEDALRKSEELYRLLAEHSHDMIILHKPDGTLIYASPSCERMLGFTHEELFSMSLGATLHPDDIARTAHAHQRVLAERTTVEIDYRLRKKDGDYIWVSSFAKPILDENGDVKQLLAVSRDITERKQAEQLELNIERLKASFQKEQEQNALVQRVVSMLSHDLRTPLAVIASSRDILHRYFDRLSVEAREEKLVSIERQVRFAIELLEDAVNTVKGPLNAREFMPSSVDLAVLCQISIDEIQGAQDDDHDMQFVNEGDIKTVSVDEVLVSRILINLLSNAIKYSPTGSEIRLELDHSEQWIILRVSDQGIGISADDLPHIFDPFYRADDVHHINGTGLGLNIIKDCVDRHQGRMHVESKLGRGSTFTVELPMQVDSSDQ